MNAPLRAYLEIAHNFYMRDELEVAMQVVRDASAEQGWPANSWIEFYNELQCEADARAEGELHEIDRKLAIEAPRAAPAGALDALVSAALKARDEIKRLLAVRFKRRVLITVFLPDAPTEFISGSHGYASRKFKLNKICLPYGAIEPRDGLAETLIHEFAHVATDELVRGAEIPRWLHEGLATYLCGDMETPGGRSALSRAVRNARLFSLDRLDSLLGSSDARMDDPDDVVAAYYLAASLMKWWAGRFSLASVRRALRLIGRGWSVESAVHKATGMPLGEVEGQWRRELLPSP